MTTRDNSKDGAGLLAAFHALLADLQAAWSDRGGAYQVGHGDLCLLEQVSAAFRAVPQRCEDDLTLAHQRIQEQQGEIDQLKADGAARRGVQCGEETRLRACIEAIRRATLEGRVCDDVAWFDDITTLHDFCELALHGDEDGPSLPVTATAREERLLRCISMAMGCLSPHSQRPDERLAWYRLLDAKDGREPRASLVLPSAHSRSDK